MTFCSCFINQRLIKDGVFMRYYISDLHFFHSNLNDHMDNRGFSNAEEMNRYMIRQWNSRVRNGDDVVILGDFSTGNAEETMGVLKQLKGKKYLIQGNHDRYLKDKDFDRNLFQWIQSYKELNDNRRKVVLSHYPIFCYNGQFRMNAEGNASTYMLYGHVHDTYDEFLVDNFQKQTRQHIRSVRGKKEPVMIPCQMINCFCMFSDYIPLTLDEWIENDRKRREKQ